MRKIILVLAILFTVSASAHTMNPLGYCADSKQAVFQTLYFGKMDSVEVQYRPFNTSTWLTMPNGLYVTGNSSANIINVGVPQSSVNETVTIRYRWKTRNSNGSYGNWSNWSTATAKKTMFDKCSNIISLPVRFKSFNVTRFDAENLKVTFTTDETENVKTFYVTVSLDGKTFKTVALVPVNTYQPNSTYVAFIKIKSLKN